MENSNRETKICLTVNKNFIFNFKNKITKEYKYILNIEGQKIFYFIAFQPFLLDFRREFKYICLSFV